MIRKGRFLKNTAVALAIISVFGSTLTSVSAMEVGRNITTLSQYVDGSYELNTVLKHETKDENSMANTYLKSSKLEISNGKMYMVMVFSSGSMLKEINSSINGNAVANENTLDDSSNTRTIKFLINSLDDEITLGLKINPFGNMVIDANCRVKSESVNIPTTPGTDDVVTETPAKENISVTLRHLTDDKDSSGNKYLQSSELKTVNGKKYIVMTFNSGNMFTAMQVSIKGKDVETKFEKNEETDTATVEFEISSLADYMELSFSYNTPIGAMTHSAKIQTIENVSSVKPEEDDAITSPTPTPDTGDDSNSGSTGGSDSNNGTNSGTDSDSSTGTYKNGYYQLKNNVHIDNAVGYSMVRNLLSETTNMEVKDGKTYMTLRMSSYSLMNNVSIKVNNKATNFTTTKIDNDTVEFTVEVPDVNAKLTMSMFVTAMGQNVEFGVSFNKDSVKFISSNEAPTIPDSNGGSNNGSINSGTTGGSTTNDTTTNQTVKGKLYTIKNEIVSDNATGKAMARKYLNSTTKIEEVNGQMYATLTFTGVDLMSNHKIYVNGSLVNYTVTSSTSSSKSIRFAIPNVNADIKVQVYVVPMSNTVTFGVKLLEDTLTFVKDYEVENGTLPQTGSVVNSEILLGMGGLLTMSGALLRRKRK